MLENGHDVAKLPRTRNHVPLEQRATKEGAIETRGTGVRLVLVWNHGKDSVPWRVLMLRMARNSCVLEEFTEEKCALHPSQGRVWSTSAGRHCIVPCGTCWVVGTRKHLRMRLAQAWGSWVRNWATSSCQHLQNRRRVERTSLWKWRRWDEKRA